MRDDHSKQIEELKDKTNHTEQIDELISSPSINDQRNHGTSSDPPSEREVLIKQYYSQKIHDLETKLQLANGKGISFYNEVCEFIDLFFFLMSFLFLVGKYSSTFKTFERSRRKISNRN
jgi:hypothetical protein